MMYANINGATGKATSLITAAQTCNSHIITLSETKLTSHPPQMEGYSWITQNRTQNKGGGTGILIRNDIIHTCQQVTDLEDQNQDVCWAKIQMDNSVIHIGVYYGKQEQAPAEDIRDEFAKRTAQVIQMKQQGEIILTGDFNAKIAIPEDESIQKESRNGKIMMEFIQNTGLIPMSIKPQHGLWTRENRHNPKEKSVMDYILTTPTISTQVNNLAIDEEGTLRLKGKNESNHNTIMFEVTGKIRKKTWKKMDMANKQWRSMVQLQQSNRKHPWEQNKGLQHIRKTPQENNGNPHRENNNYTRHNKETK